VTAYDWHSREKHDARGVEKSVGAVCVVLLAVGVRWGQPRPDAQRRLGVRLSTNPGGGVKVVEVFPDNRASNTQVGL
jgi:hypothetical protein